MEALRRQVYRDIVEKGDIDRRRKYFVNQARVKGFIQKHKDIEPFKGIYDFISAEFKGKFPCCQPLDKKYCNRFFDCIWSNEEARKIVSQEFKGHVIEYVSSEGKKRMLVL